MPILFLKIRVWQYSLASYQLEYDCQLSFSLINLKAILHDLSFARREYNKNILKISYYAFKSLIVIQKARASMSSEELNQDQLNQDELNKEMLLKIFYETKGNIDDINSAIDKSIFGTQVRSLTLFEKFVRARLSLNPKVLRLVDMSLTWFEMAYLSQYSGLENVENLDLRKNQLGDDGLDALLSSERLGNIRKLDLRNNSISRNGMEILAKSDKLKKLEQLDLRSNRIGKAWEDKLRFTSKFPNLSSLKIA